MFDFEARRDCLKQKNPNSRGDVDVDLREEEVAKIDMERMVVVGGQEEDETSLLVKDLDGNIIKGVPVGISFLQKQNSRDYI